MNPNEALARFTFNAPAERLFLPERIKGIRLRLERGRLTILPVTASRGTDVVALDSRTRGGRSAVISAHGTESRQLMRVLSQAGFSHKEPFFLLYPDEGDWLRIEHHPYETAPAKTYAHMRVWPMAGEPSVAMERRQRVAEFDMRAWINARNMVLKAQQTLSDYESGRKLGRPTKAVQQAEKIIHSFTRLVGQVAVASKGNTQLVQAAHQRRRVRVPDRRHPVPTHNHEMRQVS